MNHIHITGIKYVEENQNKGLDFKYKPDVPKLQLVGSILIEETEEEEQGVEEVEHEEEEEEVHPSEEEEEEEEVHSSEEEEEEEEHSSEEEEEEDEEHFLGHFFFPWCGFFRYFFFL